MLKVYIPNLLTFINLSLGIISIVETFHKNYFVAAALVIIAAIIDRYDGKVARLLNVSSELGKELDSLSDLISFGIAPALLIFTKYQYISTIGICISLIYIISGSYRLAKYNLSKFNGVFNGIPITISGLVITLFALAVPSNYTSFILSNILTLIFAYLMISEFKFKKI